MLKNEKIYQIIVAITFILPTSILLFLQATLFDIHPVAEIKIPIGTYQVENTEDGVFIYTDDITATIEGIVVYNEELKAYGVNIGRDDVVKINRHYKGFVFNEETKEFEFVDIKSFKMKEEQRKTIPFPVIVSGLGILIAVAIISKKMSWHKSHPREAALLALILATVILMLLDAFIGGIKNVFLAITISFALYYVEWRRRQSVLGVVVKEEKEKKESDTLLKIKEALKDYE